MRRYCGLFVLLASAVGAARRSDAVTPVEVTVEEVVVTASRSEEPVFEAPSTIQLLAPDEIREAAPRSVPEALKYNAGVAVQKTANGQGSPIIRGFTGYRTLAMIDGIRYNHSAYRDGPNEYFSLIDPLALDRMELLQGPASTLYGSDAVGGALNVFTKGADWRGTDDGAFFQRGELFGRWHSAEQSWQGRLDHELGKAGEWGLHVGGSWKSFGDVRAADLDVQPYTGYEVGSYDLRLDAALGENWTLTLAHQALWQDDVWRTHATVHAKSFAGTSVGSDFRRVTDYARSLSYARLRGENLERLVQSAQFTVSLQTLDEELDRIRDSRVRELSDMDIRTLGFDAQFSSELLSGVLTWGADYYSDDVDTSRHDLHPDGTLKARRVQGPVGDDARYDLFGVYAQHELELVSAGTLLSIGGRYTYAAADIGKYEDPVTGGAASQSDKWQNVVGSLRLTQRLDANDHWRAYGGVSQAFRAPNLGDLSRLGASRSDEIESAAVGLKPEKFTSFELGLKHRSEKLSFHLAGFYTLLDDYITSTPTGRIIDGQRQVTKQNSAEGFVRGALGEVEWSITPRWSLFGGLSWTEGEADAYVGDEVRREPLSRVPPLTGYYGLRWSSGNGKWWTEVRGLSAAKADRLNSADREDDQRIPPGGTPGYTVLNLHAGWAITEQVTITAGLDNLLDEAYRVHGSGSNEPGFGASLAVRVRF